MKAVELAKKVHERRKRYFDDLESHLNFVKKQIGEIFPDAKIYLFGSVVEGKVHPHSDIDLAVVTKNIPENVKELAIIKIKILKGLEFSPFELHILSEKEWNLYKNFIKKFREI